MIKLSKLVVEHDFRESNVIENMIWCIENWGVNVLEDYKFDVFGLCDDVINFGGIEFLVKILKSDAVDTIYTDRLIDMETFRGIIDFDSKKVFEEDYID